jgi:hypothetical protein
MNVLRCVTMKGGYVCLGFQPINVIMNDSNKLNKIWMSCLNINQKGMHDYLDILEWHTFIWSVQTLLKTSNNVMYFAPTSLIFLSKPLECKFVNNKINLIIFISTFVLWKNTRF